MARFGPHIEWFLSREFSRRAKRTLTDLEMRALLKLQSEIDTMRALTQMILDGEVAVAQREDGEFMYARTGPPEPSKDHR